MTNLKRTLLNSLLLAVFAVLPFGTASLKAAEEPLNTRVEQASFRYGFYYGSPYRGYGYGYGRGYGYGYRPYYYYSPYRGYGYGGYGYRGYGSGGYPYSYRYWR